MTTVGFGSGSNSSNNPRNERMKKRKRSLTRLSLLESLEARHLMAAGPQLIGVQPNEGSLIALGSTGANATVLNTSPRELVLRFDDSSAIDSNTFSGIQIKRAGADGILDSAYLSTDLGTSGNVVLDFSASLPGQQGNGLELYFTQVSRSTGPAGKPASYPILSVSGQRINIEVNIAAAFKTTAQDLIRAMSEDTQVASRVLVKRLRGLETAVIADTVPANQVLTLQGADSARVSTNLNSGSNLLQVEFVAVRSGSAGSSVRVEVTNRDFGTAAAPNVTVSGQTVRVELNSNSRFQSTVQDLISAINNSTDAQSVVFARLVSGSPSQRIGANSTSYSPLLLTGGDDQLITPAYVGYGNTDREVVIRFAEALPDDSYLIDILGSGPFALRNAAGLAFNGGVNRSVRFDLDLGTTIQAVVPQPVVRNANGTLSQLRNQIYVYFNDDDLNAAEAVKTQYYKLVYTGDTIQASDDVVLQPSSVNYDATLNRAALVFDRNLDTLVDGSGNPLPIAALRLRIGNDESPNGSVTQQTISADPGSRFDSATDLGGAWLAGSGAKAVIVDSEIRNTTPYKLDFPGANDEAGNRDNAYQHHVTRVDTDGIAEISYNFASQLGNANRSVQLNAITESQKNMVRQVMSLYEKYLGVRFTESDNLGLTIAVGDMQAINPLTSLTTVEANRPGGLTYAAGPLLSNPSQSAVILDIQDFNQADDNVFGSELFRSFMRGIGVLLGLGNADELPQATIQNNSPITDPNVDSVFPGNADIIHGQYILRPESKDIDLYRFTVPAQGGKVEIQIAAERASNSSLLDAALKLYRNEGTSTSPVWVQIAANDDYFSEDPKISLEFVNGGEYIVGVSAKGNTSYNPMVEDSGIGGRSEGKYQLRIDYRPPAATALVDADGTPTQLDGDGDGRPGGVFNYWFVPTRPDRATPVVGVPDTSSYTIWVDKTASAFGNGTLAAPYNTISRALQEASNVVAADATGKRSVSVRIVGNTQNRAYEIGFGSNSNPLADGSTFDVPKNVSVMIDAGVIIKMGRARISAGSSTVSVNRSGGSLQLLGTPDTKVIVTSINDSTGVGSATPSGSPAPGDWGGIDFRNRIDGSDETRTDKERNGLFLNTVVHSDIRYGGGQVIVDGVSQVITPIHMIDSRPSVANNLITRSADAAMSATPNSFKEDDFLDPRSQSNGFFIADFNRVGPDIHGNRVINNTINGLFIKTQTPAAQTLESVTVAARFDDLDIPHVIGENLVVAGAPGGSIVDSAAPPTTIVQLAASTGGSLAAGSYNYRLVYVDASGNESLSSIPTVSVTTVANSRITLTNLPPISSTLPYVARRLYRSDATGGGTYRLVAQLNAIATTFVDNGAAGTTPLNPATAKLRPRLDGSLTIDAGTIVKLQGSRIEVRDGAQLLAEGTDGLPIVMTSINDARYGFGGTFDTANSKGLKKGEVGDWGGIYVGPGSSASLDFNRISFGGGTTRIEGDFASFNAIEVHQGDFRMVNSRMENNDAGIESATPNSRLGRGTNAPAALFVRGAQPIIINNRFSDNGSAAINIDVNSLGPDLVNDSGRSTGLIDLAGDFPENQGPLIHGNRLSRNSTNGMVVRGQTLTTQSVWDDTDIVHVVQSTITSDNLHTYGGLRLKSSPTESLVVKFGGGSSLAGLTATGTPSDYSNRIGGSVQIVGQPGFPVVLTSLSDDSVGAGFGVDGRSAFDTNNDGGGSGTSSLIVLPTGPEVDRGTLIDNDVDVNRPGYFAFQPQAGGGATLGGLGGITAQGTSRLFVNEDVIFAFINYIDVGSNGGAINLASTVITRPPTLVSPDLVVSEGTFTGNNNSTVRWRVESRFDNGVAQLFNTLILESDQALGNISFINYLDEDIQGPSDDFLYVTGTPGQSDFRAYTIDSEERFGFSHGGIYQPGVDLQNATYSGWAADQFRDLANAIEGNGTNYSLPGNINLTNLPPINDPVVGQVYGLADVTTALAWQTDPNATSARITSFLELVPQSIQRNAAPGAWNGISMQTYSNDRNVAVVSERESARANAPASNDSPQSSQPLGQLAKSMTGGDENARLGFEIQGVINKPSDVDVYSFYANGRTEVWLDIDRTTSSLDTVVELVAADGTILALSDNSYLEETDALANPLYSALSGNSVHPLRQSSLSTFPTTSRGEARDDYGTNPKDAGMRVLLPGQSSATTLYHIRVRSSNQFPGQPANTPALSDPASVGKGRSHGAYQLQVRLSEQQELPGSSVSFADVRFATTGLTLSGVPRHSPLVGETSEQEARPNNLFVDAQELGNILQTDRRTIALAGSLSSSTDVDWFTFTIDYQQLVTPLAEYLSTVFDIDYADGIGRADMSMYLYNAAGNLIQFGENSNILEDRASSIAGAGNSDLGRGSTGTLDPFIGAVALPAGRYFLAVTNRTQVPAVLANRLSTTGADNSGIRVQPANGTQLIVEDRVGSSGSGSTAIPPVVPQFLPTSSRVEYVLGDVPVYLTQQAAPGSTNVLLQNAFSGQISNFVGNNSVDIRDVAIRANGDIRSYRSQSGVGNANADTFVQYTLIDPGTGATTVAGTTGITTQYLDNTLELAVANVGFNIEALTFMQLGFNEEGYFVANRVRSPLDGRDRGIQYFNNILYRFDPSTGAAISSPAPDDFFNLDIDNAPDQILGAGTSITERGYIETNAPAGTFSTSFAVSEATDPRSAGFGGDLLIRDGDLITLTALPNTQVPLEFNAGPEIRLNFDPVGAPNRVLLDGDQFTLDGVIYQIETSTTPVSTPGVRTVFYSPTMNNEQFVTALRQAMLPTVQVGFDGTRVNFSGATTGSFGTLVSRNVAADLGSNGNVRSGSIAINFLAEDTAETIAARIVQAINTSGFAGLSASQQNSIVQLVGARASSATGSTRLIGVAPGGNVTGVAGINGVLYAVSDRGGLYSVSTNNLLSNTAGNIANFITSSYQLNGIRFTGLTAGPRNVAGGIYANLLFGTDANGTVYAFNTSGQLQNVFANGRSSVSTGQGALNGLAFSNLDFNLWHQSNRRAGDSGHGIIAPPDASRGAAAGDTSWYFGLEGFNNLGAMDNANFGAGFTSARAQGAPLAGTYNFPGGASGVMESQPFSLAGMTEQDLPTLYFNYFLSTEDASSAAAPNVMRDSFRVYGMGDSGTWELLTTNNADAREAAVERTVDNTVGGTAAPAVAWRQARVDLGSLAGSANVRLRFEFSTAGGMGNGLNGGKGLEMRVVAGKDLRDGQTFNIGGRQFEIEMGPTLVMPSGAAIVSGDSFTVRGVTFTYWDGVGASPAGNVIRFLATDSPNVIANNTLAAINAATFPKPTSTANLADPAGGSDVLTRAISIGVTGGAMTVTADGAIGDNPTLSTNFDRDIDLIGITAEAGSRIVIDASATVLGSPLDPYLRLFDATGTEILANNDFGGIRDSRLTFNVATSGRYYIGVSGSTNTRYYPAVANSGINGGSTGQYRLTVDVTPRFNASVVDNRIQLDGAETVSVPANSPITLDGSYGVNGVQNTPVYILQTMTAAEVAAEVKRVLEITLAGGNDQYSTFNRNGDMIELQGVAVTDDGPFTLSGIRSEDLLSEYGIDPLSRPAYRARANNFEGLYLDDFLIGTAERGEMVTGARADTTFVTVASPGSDILSGPYQLEIRGGSEYGTPNRGSGITLNRAFAVNQSLSSTQVLRFNSASAIADGDLMTISDGSNSLTFEFDDSAISATSPAAGVRPGNIPITFNSALNESGVVIASRVRDIINSPTVQSVLRISAISTDGSITGQNTSSIALVGSATVNLPASVGILTTGSQALRFNPASSLVDGQTLVINNGSRIVTFEFDDATQPTVPGVPRVAAGNIAVTFNPTLNESGAVIAARVRDLINSPAVSSILNVYAVSSNGSLTGVFSNEIRLVGLAAISMPTSVGVVVSDKLVGDRNTTREQGQVIVENSKISNSAGFGITLQADARDAVSNAPNPGSVRNTLTLNNQRLVPGAVVMNNELYGNSGGGINIVGDTNSNTTPNASVPFARIVNNTILGGTVTRTPEVPAATFAGDFYATGTIAFADSVVSYLATAGGGPAPVAGLQTPAAALGVPNYSGIGEPLPNQGAVSLGRGGRLTVQFTNNILTGSNDARPDLAIYEVGTSELVKVEVSVDGTTYTNVGTASFNNRFIDLDAYGFNALSQIFYVRVTDEPNDGPISGDSVGADIDAIGALSSKPGLIYTARGTGIRVGQNASPTLLNNIVTNSTVGIFVDPSSTSTVIGATLYQGNASNVGGSASPGQFAQNVQAGVPLFTDPAAGNLYPVPGSAAIDSTIDSLVDRTGLLAVKRPLGLADSPIIAPTTDITGMLRVDDPSVAAPPGIGESVFKDRGAADRSDFIGPSAFAVNPADNDALGADTNPLAGVVELVSSTLDHFDVQLLDTSALGALSQGTGVDSDTVSPNAVLLYKNGSILVEGMDYRFGYDSTSHIIRLTPLSGVWESESVYQIRFVNTNESLITVPEPRNIIDGTTYTILNAAGDSTYFELDTGIKLKVPTAADGFTNSVTDGTIFRLDDGFQRITFELDRNSSVRSGNVQVLFDAQDTAQVLASKIVAAVRQTTLNLTISSIGSGEIQVLGSNLVRFVPEDSRISFTGATGVTPGYGLRIPTANGVPVGLTDGQRFTIQRGSNVVVFELDNNGAVGTNNVAVPMSTVSVSGMAAGIVNAINASSLGLTATATAGGLVSIGTASDVRIQATSTVLEVVGLPGRPAATAVTIDLTTVQSSSQAAALVASAINSKAIAGVSLTQLGSRIFIEGAEGVAGLGAEQVSGIRDKAGNAMRATESNGQTVVTIFLGDGYDYGDAPDPLYASKKNSGGPRHKVVDGFSLGATVSADADAKTPYGDDDDGVTFTTITSTFGGSMSFIVEGASAARPAIVDAWIDFNGNGTFESSEKLPQFQGRIVSGVINTVNFSVPSTAKTGTPVAARVRLNSATNLGPTGDADSGEVEDYAVTINANPYQNQSNRLDVNGDGFVSPIDVLQLVNYVNTNGSSALPFPPASSGPPYLDVNGDGFASVLDILQVINYINSQTNGGGSGEGEGASDDMWVSAASLAAPTVAAPQSNSQNSNTNSASAKSNTLTSLDAYLAQTNEEVGPFMLEDEIDWSALSASDNDDDKDESSKLVTLALDDLFNEFE